MECQPVEVLNWSRMEQQSIRCAVVVAMCALKYTLAGAPTVIGVGFVWDAVREKVGTDDLPALFLLIGGIGRHVGYVFVVGRLCNSLLG